MKSSGPGKISVRPCLSCLFRKQVPGPDSVVVSQDLQGIIGRYMSKRLLLTALTLLVVYSAVVIGIKIFEPEKPDEGTDSLIAAKALNYEALRDYTINSGSAVIHYYLFWSMDNNDCKYVADTVLKDCQAETGVNLSELIEIVDITELERNLQTNRLKTDWNVSSYPAFIACRTKAGRIIIDNSLEWNPAQPISVDDLKRWLTLNGLYEEKSGVIIETPMP